MGTIANRAETLLGATVVATTPVAGGDICTSTRLRLSDGSSALVKTRPHAPDDFFTTEAEGLRWLAETPGAAVPEVLAAEPDCLDPVLGGDRPPVGGRRGAVRPAAGRDPPCRGAGVRHRVRAGGLHRHPAAAEPAGPHVARVLRHPPHPAVPQAGPGPRQHRPGGRRRGGGRRPPDRRPRRARGAAGADPRRPLVGQRAVGQDGRGWLVDPAAHGGHRESDLALLALFGLPQLPRVLDAYTEEAPLADGWEERVPLHQLFPLLVHACLFGGGYGARAAEPRVSLGGAARMDRARLRTISGRGGTQTCGDHELPERAGPPRPRRRRRPGGARVAAALPGVQRLPR